MVTVMNITVRDKGSEIDIDETKQGIDKAAAKKRRVSKNCS